MRPLVSVITPTFDRREYLEEAVASVRAQTYPTWEMIVADDGSTDGTREWLATVGDKRIRLLAFEHTGSQSRLRNAAVAEARGDYVAFLDSDDRWHPTKLARQMEAWAHRPDCGWSCTDIVRVDADGRRLTDVPWWRVPSGHDLQDILTLTAPIATSAAVVRRDLYEEVGGLDEGFTYCQDYELWFRLAARSPIYGLPEALVDVRIHDTNHQRDRCATEEHWVRVYAKTERWVPARLRSTCRRERALHGLRLAAAYLDAKRAKPACVALARAVAAGWHDWHIWRRALGMGVRRILQRGNGQ
jgi:glycosyltransferase involved in cell wall biosynthesis